MLRKTTVIVRGGGDLATGIIYRLWKVGYPVISLETQYPLVVRRSVSVASAIFSGSIQIEDMKAVRVNEPAGFSCEAGPVPVAVDPNGETIARLHPDVVIDAIMAKKNLGTTKEMAPLVIAIGPGFSAPGEVHAVIETKRGHTLGRVITDGSALPNTGVPGLMKGYGVERLLRAPCDGYLLPVHKIGDRVKKGEVVGYVNGAEVCSQLDGILRGLIHPTVYVSKDLKIGDVDPRGDPAHCWSITDKALAIAGGVLEVLMSRDFTK